MPISASDIASLGSAGGNPVEAMASGYKLADLASQQQLNKMKMASAQQEMQDVQTLKSLAKNYDLSTQEGQAKYVAEAIKVNPEYGMKAQKSFAEVAQGQNELLKSQYDIMGKQLEAEAGALAPLAMQARQMQSQGRTKDEINAALMPAAVQSIKALSQTMLPNGKPVLPQEQAAQMMAKFQDPNLDLASSIQAVAVNHAKFGEMLKMQQQKFGTTKTMTGPQGPGVYQQNATTGEWTKVGGMAPTAAERGGGAAGGGGAAPLSANAADLIIDRIKNGESVGDATKGLGPLAKRQVVNRMGELAAQTDENGDPLIDAKTLFNARIEAGAVKKATETAGTQAGKLKIAEKELDQFATPALAASQKVPRGSFVPLNKLNQMVDSAISDPNLREFKMWGNSLSNTYDQIAGRGGTDMEKRAEVRDLLSTAPDAESFKRVIDVMRQELKGAEVATAEAMKAGSYQKKDNEGGAPSIQEGHIIRNPKTGERKVLKGGEWVPMQ